MSPQRKRGQFFFERRFLFSKDDWISFQKDFRICHLVFQRDVDLVFYGQLDLDGLTQGYDLVFLSDSGPWFFFGLLDFGFSWIFGPWFFFGSLDVGFLSDSGLWFFSGSLDAGFSFGFLDSVFSFGRWIL